MSVYPSRNICVGMIVIVEMVSLLINIFFVEIYFIHLFIFCLFIYCDMVIVFHGDVFGNPLLLHFPISNDVFEAVLSCFNAFHSCGRFIKALTIKTN